jgi:hypothetical protein
MCVVLTPDWFFGWLILGTPRRCLIGVQSGQFSIWTRSRLPDILVFDREFRLDRGRFANLVEFPAPNAAESGPIVRNFPKIQLLSRIARSIYCQIQPDFSQHYKIGTTPDDTPRQEILQQQAEELTLRGQTVTDIGLRSAGATPNADGQPGV